jgi:hypothetical protein
MLMYQMMETGQWQISSACQRLLECLPTLTRDTVNVEDIRKVDGDDPADSARYGLKSRMDPARMPAELAAAARVSAQDPTSRAIWLRKFADEARAGRAPTRLPRRW